MASVFTSSQCCRVDVESHSARCITNGISKITPYILFHGLAATPPFGGVQCIILYIAGACAPAYWLLPLRAHILSPLSLRAGSISLLRPSATISLELPLKSHCGAAAISLRPPSCSPARASYHAPLSCKTIMRATRAIMQGAQQRAVHIIS